MKLFLSVFFTMLLGCVVAQKKETAIINKVEALNRAVFIDKDSIALENLLSKNLTYGHSGGKIEDKVTMIHNAVHNTTTYPTFKMDSVHVLLAGKTAIARAFIQSKTVDKGVEGNLHLGLLLVWLKENKDWKLLARQAVKL